MSGSILDSIRREAKQRNLPWPAVRAAYDQVKTAEREKREHANEVRQTAWCMASSPGCWPFWRHGFLARWGRKLAQGHDYTCVPGYDDLAQEVAAVHPEYSGDDGTEQLFEFLFLPYDKLPPIEEMYRKALELADYSRRTLTANEPVPF